MNCRWFLLILPGLPIILLILLSIYSIIEYYNCMRRSTKFKVGDSFIYYKENPFIDGFCILKINEIWDDYISYSIDEFDSNGSRGIPEFNSGRRIQLQKFLDKYNAKKINK